jgi:cell division protein FtsB
MNLMQEMHRRLLSVLPSLLGVCLCVYFGYHAVQGDRGIIRLMQLKQDIKIAEEQRALTWSERKALEDRVASLKPGSLDADMIEERARILLNMGREGELIILDPSVHALDK